MGLDSRNPLQVAVPVEMDRNKKLLTEPDWRDRRFQDPRNPATVFGRAIPGLEYEHLDLMYRNRPDMIDRKLGPRPRGLVEGSVSYYERELSECLSRKVFIEHVTVGLKQNGFSWVCFGYRDAK